MTYGDVYYCGEYNSSPNHKKSFITWLKRLYDWVLRFLLYLFTYTDQTFKVVAVGQYNICRYIKRIIQISYLHSVYIVFNERMVYPIGDGG